jgi:hypothetical protein
MANVNWNNEIAESVYKLTKKYPAAVCYDFIHICYSPANWIDYTNITPVKQWSDAGGIVQLMWHFNVPKAEGSTDVTCTPSETTFRAQNVFTTGSWENRWFYEQMDKVVATLLKLQDAGIAATWRPFHEAAGNYYHNPSWGAWFWWGADGADTYKRLWTTMFDYFREKGVHNLIWVWTTQNYNGNSAEYDNDAPYYPGDDYVDIIGRDLYGSTAAQNEQEYRELQGRYPDKMITLAECAVNGATPFSSVADLWNAGARWSWFMPWYGASMPANSWWSDALSQQFVITRDQVRLDATYVEESAASACKNMRLAWNLGNTLDSNGAWIGNNQASEKYETAWGQPVTKPELMAFLKQHGFNAVRVPVTWWQHVDANDNID